ncbi:unnamed protein product [Soboliphyme baturini]|uniref:HCO3_cotransp domain-containing protein n=1 Tax=Soboliphyme baturini TaxID=241478 RepID=A0A183IA62_9BILA|nr:unnamed protein product [Soboliphyme baturini]
MWTALFLLILIAVDASALVAFITRFTEEAFATLISLIFLVKAFQELIIIGHESPPVIDVQSVFTSPCRCNANASDVENATTSFHLVYPSSFSRNNTPQECFEEGGTLQGLQCFAKPEVFIFSIALFVATFVIAKGLKEFRHSKFFSSRVSIQTLR